MVNNQERLLQQFDYDQGPVTLSDGLSTLIVLVAKPRFMGHSISQIMAGKEKFFWPRLACVGVRSLGGVLFWNKFLGLMNAFVKGETM